MVPTPSPAIAPTDASMPCVLARLGHLERLCRRLTAALVLLLVGLAVAGLAGAMAPVRAVVGTEFVLVDAKGERRAVIDTGKDGTQFAIMDAGGTGRLILSITDAGDAAVALFGKGGPKNYAMLTMDPDGKPGLEMVDPRGKVVGKLP